MKLITCLVLLTTSAFAGRIVPNIEWNQVIENDSGAAIAQSKRNNATLEYRTSDYKNNDSDFRSDIQSTKIKSFVSIDKFSFEGSLVDYRSSETGLEEYKNKNINMSGGTELVKNLYVGTTINYTDNEDFRDNTMISVSVVNQFSKKFSIGGGVNYQTFNDTDADSKTYNLGFGFIKNNMALESYVKLRPSVDTDGFTVSDRKTFIFRGTMTFGNIQVSPFLYSLKTTNDFSTRDNETNIVSVGSKLEYKFSERFFIGGSVFVTSTEFEDNLSTSNDNIRDSLELGFTGRYKLNNIQVIGEFYTAQSDLDFEVGSDSSGTEDITRLRLAYFF